MMKSVIETIKANKGTIVKKGLLGAVVIGGTILVAATLSGDDENDEIEFAEEDFETEEIEEEVPTEEE